MAQVGPALWCTKVTLPPPHPLPLPVSPQAIAHYEQSADYYKGEESNRYRLWAPFPLPYTPPHPTP